MFKRSFIFALAVFLGASASFAFDDGFAEGKKIDGKNVILYLAPQLNVPSLIQQLNMSPSAGALFGRRTAGGLFYTDQELADMLDALYTEVCSILDMHLYSLQINVKVCNTNGELGGIYKNLFNAELKGRFSFYVYENNTVYVSAEHFKPEIMGHEIAHAVMNHYFVVPPPVKVQEVLAMFVEYQLRKK